MNIHEHTDELTGRRKRKRLAKLSVDTHENGWSTAWPAYRTPRDPSPQHITLSEARSRLYRRRSLQVNSRFAAFKFFQDLQDLHTFALLRTFFPKDDNLGIQAAQNYENLVDLEKS